MTEPTATQTYLWIAHLQGIACEAERRLQHDEHAPDVWQFLESAVQLRPPEADP